MKTKDWIIPLYNDKRNSTQLNGILYYFKVKDRSISWAQAQNDLLTLAPVKVLQLCGQCDPKNLFCFLYNMCKFYLLFVIYIDSLMFLWLVLFLPLINIGCMWHWICWTTSTETREFALHAEVFINPRYDSPKQVLALPSQTARQHVWLSRILENDLLTCYKRCDTLNNPHCSMANCARHRSKFDAIHWQWWHL